MSAPARICPRCHRKEGEPNHQGNPIRFNRKRGLCYGCAHSLRNNPDATPWHDPTTGPKTCARCGRTEGEKTQHGQPLTFPGSRSKYANYCHPCIGSVRTGRPLQHRPNPKERCKVCGRRHTKANPIGGPEAKYPGFCLACRITVDRRSRTYPIRPCTECGQTHNSRGILLAVVTKGPNVGLCERCRFKKRRRERKETQA